MNIEKTLTQLLSGAQDRDADTEARKAKGQARFDKAYFKIVDKFQEMQNTIENLKVDNKNLKSKLRAKK